MRAMLLLISSDRMWIRRHRETAKQQTATIGGGIYFVWYVVVAILRSLVDSGLYYCSYTGRTSNNTKMDSTKNKLRFMEK